MKTRFLVLCTGLFNLSIFLQAGEFLNLGFDNPNLSRATPFGSGFTDLISDALQGWQLADDLGRIYTTQNIYITDARISPLSLTAGLNIPGSDWDFGKYSLFIGGVSPHGPPAYHLSQIGTIPNDIIGLQY